MMNWLLSSLADTEHIVLTDQGSVRGIDVATLADLSLAQVGSGWDNTIYRLGADYGLRVCHGSGAAQLVERSRPWISTVASPLRHYRIDASLPLAYYDNNKDQSWTLTTWVPGQALVHVAVEERADIAEQLATAVASLHRPAPTAAPTSQWRGTDLASRMTAALSYRERCVEQLGSDIADALCDVVQSGAKHNRWPFDPVWLHGDLHARNIVGSYTDDGALTVSGLIDFDDLCAGDPASDLAVAWMVLDQTAQQRFWSTLMNTAKYDDMIYTRSRGWAAYLTLAIVAVEGRNSALITSSLPSLLRSP